MATATAHHESATARLLDAWKVHKGIDTDFQASKALKISHATISNWRAKRSHAAPALAGKMAKDLDENVALWCAAIEVERAHNADDRRVWEQILRQLTAAVAVLVLTLGTMPWQAIAAGKPLISKGEYTLCEIRCGAADAPPLVPRPLVACPAASPGHPGIGVCRGHFCRASALFVSHTCGYQCCVPTTGT